MSQEFNSFFLKYFWAHRFADFNKKKHAAVQIQSVFRGMKARRHASDLRQDRSALMIQRKWKGSRERKRFLHDKDSVNKVKAVWKRKKAKQVLRQLRLEARQAASLLKDKKALETKMKDMEQNVENLQEQKADLRAQLKKAKVQLAETAEVEDKLSQSLAEIEGLKLSIEEEKKSNEAAQTELVSLREMLQAAESTKSDLETECSQAKEEVERLKEELASKASSH